MASVVGVSQNAVQATVVKETTAAKNKRSRDIEVATITKTHREQFLKVLKRVQDPKVAGTGRPKVVKKVQAIKMTDRSGLAKKPARAVVSINPIKPAQSEISLLQPFQQLDSMPMMPQPPTVPTYMHPLPAP